MQNYFTLYTLFIKGDTKFWLVVLDKYKKLQTRHKGLTSILKYKSALLCCISLRCNTKFLGDFTSSFSKKTWHISSKQVPLHVLSPQAVRSQCQRPWPWGTDPDRDCFPAEPGELEPWGRCRSIPVSTFTTQERPPYTLWLTAHVEVTGFQQWRGGGDKLVALSQRCKWNIARWLDEGPDWLCA